jgi:hypothetical protein
LSTLYGPRLESYFARCRTLLARLGPRPRPRRRPTRAEIRAFLLFVWHQLFSRQGPASVSFLARVLLTRPSQFAEAARMAIKGWHFRCFTQQTLAAHAFQAEAVETCGRLEALAQRAAVGSAGLQDAVRRQAAQARRRLLRLYRRLRPEFRDHLVKDRAVIETTLRELAGR